MSSLLGTEALHRLTTAIRDRQHLLGCLMEGGVFEGGTALAMCQAAPQRRIHLFDTCAGLPTLAENHDNDRELAPGRFAVPAYHIMDRLTGYAVTLHVGTFPDTVDGLELPPIVVAHLDFDLYEPTVAGLAYVWPRLVPGGLIVVDDVDNNAAPGVRVALVESGLPYVTLGNQAYLGKEAA